MIDADALLTWAGEHRRDLPWRRTRDGWAVLVSELMLQQTQVARVAPKFVDFLGRFPTATDCARASSADVVRAWAGLGYNRRAVNLHRCARLVVDAHGGTVPDDLDALLALPGVGPYTARAVLVFAYDHDAAAVDVNVARLFARWSGRPLSGREVQALADGSVPAGRAWAWNQGLFDLGATVCTKRRPDCERCPVRDGCGWRARGCAEPDPSTGSAGASRPQSRFAGSDRQGRGRLVARLRRDGSLSAGSLGAAAGWPGDRARAERVATTLVRDGLAVWHEDGALGLPDE